MFYLLFHYSKTFASHDQNKRKRKIWDSSDCNRWKTSNEKGATKWPDLTIQTSASLWPLNWILPSFCFVLFLVSERRWMINAYMHTMPGQIRKKNSDKWKYKRKKSFLGLFVSLLLKVTVNLYSVVVLIIIVMIMSIIIINIFIIIISTLSSSLLLSSLSLLLLSSI